ncbi:MAG: hypothetical protein SNF33_02315 [Candidatus Algichlamydia australiensis]|nr:hypothetical protein [Chlamydiales bacterium]
MSEEKKEKKTRGDEDNVYFSIRLPPTLTERLEKTIERLNKSNPEKHYKQSFIYHSVVEQLDKERERITEGLRPREEGKQVRFKLKKIVAEKLNQHMKDLKNWEKNPGSRNLWITWAIENKINTFE